ncbi:hypothetical protein P691DRAFT_58834 [Macrolepiota fuliginosa MF-IS2]|uniref:Uncharacterized protein n=1 Tax=Macrolepiota fuliginosa MF-IS2 TaxID=1400762 RepID=A0A9P5XBD0_9AGAR|nr:hypothetical protein P691DRAFT_58834 [Macrolepiota fuliginosa MF-IS2]
MGNINDKNAQDTRKADPRGVLLDPKGHFDPWTDKNEARAIEAALCPGINPHYPPSPIADHLRFGDQTNPLDVVRQSLSMLLDEEDESSSEEVFGTPLQATSFQPTDAEETEDTSLPLSDSIIPETFEAAENTEPFILPTTVPTVFIRTPGSILHEVHSLETIEELNEDGALLNLGSDICDDESSLSSLGNPMAPLTINIETLAPFESTTAIPEQALEHSPFAFASNNPRVTLEQNFDIPIAPSHDLIPALTIDEESDVVGVLSPLMLAPPTLTRVNGVEERIRVSDLQEAGAEINSQDVLYVSREVGCHPDNRKSSVPFPEISAPESNSDATPYAPHLSTISLPEFSLAESAALFVSESLAHEVPGLGLIGPKVAGTVEHESSRLIIATLISPRVPDAATECKEVLTLEALPIHATRAVGDESTSSFHAESSELSLERENGPFITHLSIGIQASTVEDEIDLIQVKINNLNLNPPDNDPPPPSPPSASQRAPVLTQEKQTVTPEPCSPKLYPAIPEIRTYADATNIAIQHPELAKEVLQMPLASHHSSSTIDRFTQRIEEREGPKHTPDRPNWAKASAHGDVTAMSNPTSSGETLNRSIHTPSKPNWAAAPVLESAPTPSKAGRSQKERSRRRRGKETHVRGNNSNPESPQPTAGPSNQPKPTTTSVVSGALKFEESRKRISSFEFVPTQEQRKVAANRQKVSKWISDSSASAMGSPKSNTERGSIATPSYSVFLMDSVSDRMANEGLGVNTNFGGVPLSPASRMAEALAARKALKRGSNANKSLGVCDI